MTYLMFFLLTPMPKQIVATMHLMPPFIKPSKFYYLFRSGSLEWKRQQEISYLLSYLKTSSAFLIVWQYTIPDYSVRCFIFI